MPDTNDTSATRVRHECDTRATRVWHEWDTSETQSTRVQHECDTSATQTTRVRCEWKILILITTLVKIYFTPLYLLYGKWKTANTLARSRIVTHRKAASFLIKTILCENTSICFSKNYWKLGKMNARTWKNI